MFSDKYIDTIKSYNLKKSCSYTMMNRIDHVVINTSDRIDRALLLFESMGFIVTPRGYHTSGTINHTIVFNNMYVELLGYPEGKMPEQSTELVRRPIGLVATAIKTDDADRLRMTLVTRGFVPPPVYDLARPLELENGTKVDVKFRVTMLEPYDIPGTIIFYCQHLTPEYVWRPEWQNHANGCVGVTHLMINVRDLGTAVEKYNRAIDVNEIEYAGTNSCIIRLANFDIVLTSDQNKPLGMYKLIFVTNSLDKVEATLVHNGITYDKDHGRIFADTMTFVGCAIEFESIV